MVMSTYEWKILEWDDPSRSPPPKDFIIDWIVFYAVSAIF